MGNMNNFDGEFLIDPPIAPELLPPLGDLLSARLNQNGKAVSLYPGVNSGYVGDFEDPDDDASLRGIIAAIPAGHTVTGEMVRYGEEEGDIGRARIDSGKVIYETGSITWD